jgi:hypothetical protein
MPYYNLTNVTNATNMWTLTESVNELSAGWLGVAVLITLSVILFISLKDYPMKEAFAATCFISTVLALLLRVLGLISDFVMFIYVIATAIAVIALVANKT